MGILCNNSIALDVKENNSFKDNKITICPIYKIEKLKKIKTIGNGAFGKVIEAEYQISKEKYAVKITTMDNKQKIKTFVIEQNILSKCHHPNIISFQEVFKDRNYNTINIVLEFAEGGTLKDKIDKEKKIDENTLIFWLVQSCLALSYLKQKNIIHRDIKPENIFLTETGLIKIGDFGLSKKYKSKDNLNKTKTIAGTPYYMAPEIKKGNYNEKVDIYSLGKTIKELMKQNNYSENFVQLVNSLMETNPNIRLSIDELLKDNIINEGMKKFLTDHNYNNSLAHLIMNEINLKDEKYFNSYDNFIEDITKKREMMLTNPKYKEYDDEKDSKDLDIIMCIIDKIINENK